MSDPDHEVILAKGVEAWNRWRDENPSIRPNLACADLSRRDLKGINFRGVMLAGASLYLSDLSDSDFSPQAVDEDDDGNFTWITGPPGIWALPESLVQFVDTQKNAHTVAKHNNGFTAYADLRELRAGGANFSNAKLHCAFLSGAVLAGVDARGAEFYGAVLNKTSLYNMNLSKANFTRARFSRVNLDQVHFSAEHDSLQDGSDRISFSRRDRRLNWAKLRLIGAFPVFSVSWASLAFTLVVINGIGYFNEAELSKVDLHVPFRLVLLLIGCMLLVVGSTIYKLACPQRVQEFSEVTWVEQYRRARLQYLCESYRRGWQWPTLVTTVPGGLIAISLMIERTVAAICFYLEGSL